LKIISGNPISLLKFPFVLKTFNFELRAAAVKSLVEVFPVDPVIPIIFTLIFVYSTPLNLKVLL
jgi:hypothetical protein